MSLALQTDSLLSEPPESQFIVYLIYFYYYYTSCTSDYQALDPRSWEPLLYRKYTQNYLAKPNLGLDSRRFPTPKSDLVQGVTSAMKPCYRKKLGLYRLNIVSKDPQPV